VQAGEGKGDVAGLPEGEDAPPVEVEEFVEFGQIAGDGDEGYDNDGRPGFCGISESQPLRVTNGAMPLRMSSF
jgi:hypothetical protein